MIHTSLISRDVFREMRYSLDIISHNFMSIDIFMPQTKTNALVSKNSQDTKRSSYCSLNKCDICRHDRIKANRHNPPGLGN